MVRWIVLLGCLLAACPTGAAAQAAPATPEKLTICHATSSAKQPFVVITVSASAVGGGGNADHFAHPGDIIPPVNGHGGLNWDASGTAVYAAGCMAAALRDTDGDGVSNIVDRDDDGDGTPDARDTDDDGDGTPDADDPDTQLESDQDADDIPDGLDPDDDNDGITDERDRGTPPRGTRPPVDSDRDGINDGRDFDDDGDCILDSVDTDRDGNGMPDTSQPDTDRDGIPDAIDLDDDGDLTPDFMDPDSDGNGITDRFESGAQATSAHTLPSAASSCTTTGEALPPDQVVDLDGDGIPNASDPDDDNDGVPDASDTDQDGDGIPNRTDADDDGDGIDDLQDADPALNDDPRQTDADNDGIPDLVDPDVDGDGIRNRDDRDADGDGTPETSPATLGASFSLPAELREGEVTLLLPTEATTEQGRPLQLQVRCIALPSATPQPRSLILGDVAPVDLTEKSCKMRQRAAGVALDLQVDQPTTVIVTVQAPPTADARGYRMQTRYRVGTA